MTFLVFKLRDGRRTIVKEVKIENHANGYELYVTWAYEEDFAEVKNLAFSTYKIKIHHLHFDESTLELAMLQGQKVR